MSKYDYDNLHVEIDNSATELKNPTVNNQDNKTCDWTDDEGYWITTCGHEFVINAGSPKDNDMRFCCFCGKEIKENKEGSL